MSLITELDEVIVTIELAKHHLRRNEFRKADDLLELAKRQMQKTHQEVWLNHHKSGEMK